MGIRVARWVALAWVSQRARALLPGYDASEYLAYPALEDMEPLAGAPLLSTLSGGNWTARFRELVRASLAAFPAAAGGDAPKPGKAFDVLYGMGLQKTGTSSFHAAAQRLGYNKKPAAHPHRAAPGHAHDGGADSYRKVFSMAGRPAEERFHKLWFLDGHVSDQQVARLEVALDTMTLFEDDPWFVLHRLADARYATTRKRVGYVLTVRDCAAVAESSAAYNNPSSGQGNSPAWNREHCSRHFRRCMVHLLDVYNFLEERGRTRPLDDVLCRSVPAPPGSPDPRLRSSSSRRRSPSPRRTGGASWISRSTAGARRAPPSGAPRGPRSSKNSRICATPARTALFEDSKICSLS